MPSPRAITAATIGTPATNRAASDDEIRVSAQPSIKKGTAISITAKTTTHPSTGRNAGNRPRVAATGRSTAAARATRPHTTTLGLRSSTAILMNRYGKPQITDSARNSTQPRRDTWPPPPTTGRSGCRSGYRCRIRAFCRATALTSPPEL